jgi:hypothetical protein
VENRTWLDHLSLAVFLGRNKSDQVKSSAIKFLAQSLMQAEDENSIFAHQGFQDLRVDVWVWKHIAWAFNAGIGAGGWHE